MNLTDALAVLAGSFGVVMAGAPMLQAWRVHKMRRSEDVSVAFLVIFLIGTTFWLAYGIAITNWAVIIANCVGVVASACTVSVVLYWRGHEDAGDSSLE